jgi:hypothetical protein
MSSGRDIYQILESLDAAQRSVKQLPALFRPKNTSPQLSGEYPGDNATRGYMVGENAEDNPMAQAVARRIVNQHPEWLMKYGPREVMQAIDDVTEGDWEEVQEIGSSDVSAYVEYVGDALRDRMGSREEIADRKPFAEDEDEEQAELNRDGEPDHGLFGDDEDEEDEQDVTESRDTATEDILSAVKARLGDYIQDVATAIKKDPDLLDKLPGTADQISAVKTIRTDDGHEIKISGTEDDGFRISIKNRDAKTKFGNLDEAVMAVEMYCARRRQQALAADYIEEKTS